MKKLFVVLFLLICSSSIRSQVNAFSKSNGAGATYSPFSLNEILTPAMAMRQRHDANADKIDKLVEYIFEVKNSTNDKVLNDAMDVRFKELENLYNNERGLAHADNMIAQIKHAILKDVNTYNQRINAEKNKPKDDTPKNLNNTNNKSYSDNNKVANNNAYSYRSVYIVDNPQGLKYDFLITKLTNNKIEFEENLLIDEESKDRGITNVVYTENVVSSNASEVIKLFHITYFRKYDNGIFSFASKIVYPLSELEYVLTTLNQESDKIDTLKWKKNDIHYLVEIMSDSFLVFVIPQ